MSQLTIKNLRWIVSSRTQGRCGMHARMLKQWSNLRSLLAGSEATVHRWITWWVGTAQSWQYHELLEWFLHVCWDLTPARYAIGLLHQFTTKAEPHDQAPVLSTPDLYATA